MRFPLLITLSFTVNFLWAQDLTYTREVISYLTSKECFGRGYVKNGLRNAETFLVAEIKKKKLEPFFNGTYTQSFFHGVNTFPGKCEVVLNGKKLKPGVDFILSPSSVGLKGKFKLTRIDSSSYVGVQGKNKINLHLKKKLTYSVAQTPSDFCTVELDKALIKETPLKIKVNIQSKWENNFESRNIAAFIGGKSNSDSLIVFSAHYDHLGAMGKETFFPGANDNASGVSVILNLMDYYLAHPPKYKTLFIFFAGEEAGLLGSKYFVESKAMDLKKIKFLINLDLLGTGDDGIMVVNGAIHEKEFERLNKINTEKQLVKQIKKRGKAANSDHYWFSEAGVPCFFIYTMGGISAYHNVFDVEKTLPLTDYVDVFNLITDFAGGL